MLLCKKFVGVCDDRTLLRYELTAVLLEYCESELIDTRIEILSCQARFCILPVGSVHPADVVTVLDLRLEEAAERHQLPSGGKRDETISNRFL